MSNTVSVSAGTSAVAVTNPAWEPSPLIVPQNALAAGPFGPRETSSVVPALRSRMNESLSPALSPKFEAFESNTTRVPSSEISSPG
jgi:hypothetical protein